jgi:ATP-binding cassette, subfamily B, bacterial
MMKIARKTPLNIPLRDYIRLLRGYLAPQRRRVALLALLLAGSVSLQLVNPQILRLFIDDATRGEGTARLPYLALLFIAAALVQQGMAATAKYVGQNVGWTATNWLRRDLTAHCLKLDLSFHKAHSPGEMIERIDGDVTLLSGFFSQMSIDLMSNLVIVLGVLALTFREDWRAGAALTLFALLATVVLLWVSKVGVPSFAREREVTATFFGFLGEQLAGLEDIRSSGATGYVMRGFLDRLRGWLKISRVAWLRGASIWMAGILTFAMGSAIALGMGAYLWTQGLATIGTVYLLFTYTQMLQRPLDQIRNQLQDLQRAGAAIGRVEGLLATRAKVTDGPAAAALPGGALGVAYESVSFAYEDSEEPVLSGVEFVLQPGRVLGLLGRTGSGKTTLARLLLRLYDPTEGAVRLGGVDCREARLHHLRRRVAMVTQDVQLIKASVRDNLTFYDRSVPDEQIVVALEELGLGEWLRALPQGLETVLESGGGGCSAGEAQLLAFARLLLADPGLVILDEASSRLDPATEALIERAIGRLLQGRTAIIIAHRLATVQRADEILILEGGRVLEQGARERLATDPTSRFHHLLRSGMEDLLA